MNGLEVGGGEGRSYLEVNGARESESQASTQHVRFLPLSFAVCLRNWALAGRTEHSLASNGEG